MLRLVKQTEAVRSNCACVLYNRWPRSYHVNHRKVSDLPEAFGSNVERSGLSPGLTRLAFKPTRVIDVRDEMLYVLGVFEHSSRDHGVCLITVGGCSST